MPLNVDPAELAAAATRLAEAAGTAAGALPRSWVLPAGSDPVSAQAVPVLNAQAEALFNQAGGMLRAIHGTAGDIGASAADYRNADAEGGSRIGGQGGDESANPIAPVPDSPRRIAPVFEFPMAGASIDPLTFAEHLHSGPGAGPATGFADDVRRYLGGAHTAAADSVAGAARTMQNWTPVGDDAAAVLSGHGAGLEALGTGLQTLADGAQTYSDAFTTAKATHPTPREIIAARSELLAAMRSKNDVAMADALAKFQEQNARSAAVITSYAGTVGAKTGADAGSGAASTADTAADSGSGGSSDSSALTSMLPMLMSMMNPQQDSSQDGGEGDDADGLYADDDGGYLPDYGAIGSATDTAASSLGGSVGDATSAADNTTIGAMPMVAAAGKLDSASLPAASATEPYSGSASAASQAAAAGRSGSGMPYMPMMPGGAGAGAGGTGAERSRVVAWHPDRLMYVDDTPHTEQVIGEKPTIAPTATPPTPIHQAPSGGTP